MFNETAHSFFFFLFFSFFFFFLLCVCVGGGGGGVVRERLLPCRVVVAGLYRLHGLRVSSLCPVIR